VKSLNRFTPPVRNKSAAVEPQTALQKKLGQHGSPFKRYHRSVVGQNGYLQLFLYEIINFFLIPLPGRTGLFFRRLALPLILGRLGKKVHMGPDCTIRNGRKIFIGQGAIIGTKVTLDVKTGENALILGDGVRIGSRTILNCNGAVMEIGNGTNIGTACRLGSLKGLKVGQRCQLGEQVCISGASHAFSDTDISIIHQPVTCKGQTVIGDQVTIGERVTILDGVTIGDGVTIMPGSLVNKDIATGALVSGVPARLVST